MFCGEKHEKKAQPRRADKARIVWKFCQGRRCQGDGLDEMGGDQPVKRPIVGEPPAEVGLAGAAEGDLPAVTGKPGELRRRITLRNDTRRLAETANLEGDAGGVEKSVVVAVVDCDALPPVGDLRATGGAEESLVIQFLRRAAGLRVRQSGDLRGAQLNPATARIRRSAALCPCSGQQLPAPYR